MIQQLYHTITLAALSCIAGMICFPLLIKWSGRLGLIDAPNSRKLHTLPKPVVGGLGILLTLALMTGISSQLLEIMLENTAFLLSLFIITGTGIADDRKGLSPRLRLSIQVILALFLASNGIKLESLYGFLGIYQMPVAMQYIVTILFITGFINAFNLIDGADGLAAGLALISIALFTGFALFTGAFDIALLLAVVGGALAAFLYFNRFPAKTFLGDSGSYLLGLFISVMAIQLSHTPADVIAGNYAAFFPGMCTAALAVPVIDALRVFLTRYKNGNPVFKADKTHLHHKLLQNGITHAAAVHKIYRLHLFTLTMSAILLLLASLSLTLVVLAQAMLIVGYAMAADFHYSFSKWVALVKKIENQY